MLSVRPRRRFKEARESTSFPRRSVKRIEELETEREAAGALSEKQALEFDGIINQIADRINASAPFSAFARACLRQNGDLGWNTELLATA